MKDPECVQIQHRGGDAIYARIKGMTREEELAYWRQQEEEFRAELEEIRRKHKAAREAEHPELETETSQGVEHGQA
jgi:hypothetical protein